MLQALAVKQFVPSSPDWMRYTEVSRCSNWKLWKYETCMVGISDFGGLLDAVNG